LPSADGVLVMPLVDALDPERASQTINALLVRRRRAVAQGRDESTARLSPSGASAVEEGEPRDELPLALPR
jgi:hypothetical protein